MNTRDDFINSDDFDHNEALEAAIDKRKFLLYCTLYFHNKFVRKDIHF